MGLPVRVNQAIAANAEDSERTIRVQDLFMPLASMIRIMRRILPPHAKISGDSKVNVQECVAEFISFVTEGASDRCQREQLRTITTEDMLWALSKFGFDDYIEPLTLYLQRYCEFDGCERGSQKRPMADPPAGCNIKPYHLPHNFPMAHHHGYFVYPPPMGNGYMKGEASNGRTSQCVESPEVKGKE